MAGSAVNVGHGSISISPVLAAGFGRILQQQLNSVRPPPSVDVQVNVDQRGLRNLSGNLNQAGREGSRLGNIFAGAFAALSARRLLEVNNQLGGLSNQFTFMAAKATAAVSAIGPLTALVGGLGAGFAVAGAGIGAFAALAQPQLSKVKDATTAVTKAQDEYTAALAAGDQKGIQKALEDRKVALDSLTPAQRAATLATLNLKDAFQKQSDALAPVTLGLYTRGLGVLTKLLPAIAPVAKTVGDALGGIFTRVEEGTQSTLAPGGGLFKFLDVVRVTFPRVINTLATIVTNLGVTLSETFQALVPLMFPALGVLQHLTGVLADGAGSDAFYNFIASLRPLLIPLQGAIQSIASGLGSLIKAAVPLAGPLLNTINALADALKALFQSAPFQAFVDNLKNAVASLAPLFAGLVGPLGQILATISGQVAQLIPILVPVVLQFANVFSGVIVGLSPLLPLIAQLAGVLISLLPILYPIIAAFRDAMVPVIHALMDALVQARPSLDQLVQAFISILPAVGNLVAALGPLIPSLVTLLVPAVQALAIGLNALLPIFTPILNFFASSPLLVGMGLAIWGIVVAYRAYNAMLLANNVANGRQLVLQALSRIEWAVLTGFVWAGVIAQTAMTVATWALNAAIAVLTSPITIVIIAIAALVAGVIYAYTHFQWFHNIVQSVWQGIQTVVSFVWNSVLKPIFSALQFAWQVLVMAFKAYWDYYLHPILDAFWTVGKTMATILLAFVIAPIKLAWIGLTTGMAWFWNNVLKPVFNAVGDAASFMWNVVLRGIFDAIKFVWRGLVTDMKFVWDFVLHPMFNAFMAVARFLFDNVLSPIFGAIKFVWRGLLTDMKFVWDKVLHPVFDAFGKVAGGMRDAFKAAVDGIRRVWDSLGGIFKAPINAVVFPVIRNLSHAVDEVTQFALQIRPLQKFENIPNLATGGMVTGPGTGTSDSILGVDARGVPTSRVSNGEFVVNARQTASYLPVLEAINSGSLPGFFGGGLLGAVKNVGGALVGGAVGGIKKLAGAGFDAVQWAGEKGLGLLRTGAADALDAAYHAFANPLFGLLPNTGPGQMFHAIPDRMEQTLVDWIRGKEEAAGDFSGADGTSAPLIVEYLASKGIRPGPVTTTTGVHAPGSFHYKGMAVDFGNVGNPNQRGIFNIFDAVAGSLLELFWDPAGHYVKNGRKVAGAIGGHMDHVHVAATMDAMNRLLGRGAGGSVGNLRGLVVQALSREGYPTSGPYVDAVLRQIQFESSGNPRAVQGAIGDINNRSGNLARGLMQVIPPTFAAYRDPGLPNDIFNPLANVAAALRYVRGRYGGNVTGILGHGHGYDSGGWLMPGTTLAYNQTGRPEAILTSQQWDAITSLAGGSGRTGPLVETAIIREMADVDLLAAQLDHRQRVGGF